MRYHLFQKFSKKVVKMKETSFLLSKCLVSIAHHCIHSLSIPQAVYTHIYLYICIYSRANFAKVLWLAYRGSCHHSQYWINSKEQCYAAPSIPCTTQVVSRSKCNTFSHITVVTVLLYETTELALTLARTGDVWFEVRCLTHYTTREWVKIDRCMHSLPQIWKV